MRESFFRSIFILTLVTSAAWPCRAQKDEPSTEELSTARQLFSEGIAAERAQRWEDALKIFRKIATIAPSPVVRYHVGIDAQKTGHLVEALNAFQLAVRDANKKGDDEVASRANAELELLQPKVPRLVIDVPDDAVDVTIEIDGKPMRGSLTGTAVFVDPGTRHIVIRAANYDKASEHTVSAAEGGTEKIEADLGAKVERPAETPGAQAPPSQQSSSPDSTRETTSSGQSFVPLGITIGATAALTVAAIATGVVAHNQIEDYEAANENPAPGSLADREAMRDDAVTMSWVSTGLTAGAIVGAGVTVALVIVRVTSSDDAEEQVVATPWFGPRQGGAVIVGSF